MLVNMHKPDLVVATSQTHDRDNVKVFSGVPLVTTIGQDKLFDEVFGYIKELGLGEP
jgi:hypothetical protein